MNDAFTWCVKILEFYAKQFNMTYEELNIWIFCIIEPIVFLLMLFIIIKQFVKIKKLKKSKTNQ
jgi:hypothetical protein